MSHYEYFLIFLALVFCAYASYTDLKTQKIRNFCSLGLLYAGTLSQVNGMVSRHDNTAVYFSPLLSEAGLSPLRFIGLVSFSPGDSKLFWGLCLIFPVIAFQRLERCFKFFTPLILALNIIIPYSIGVLGYLLFKFVSMRNKFDHFSVFL